jgi:AGCS family alanine or glycine:cation symporter
MQSISSILSTLDDYIWGPVMLVFLVGTGLYLTIKSHFLAFRNLGYAIRCSFGKDARSSSDKAGDISPFSVLTTTLAATIGTGNIVGVATAMAAGGPGALVWMCISAAFGMTTQFNECLLAVKYREINNHGEMSGGPMYTMKNAFKNKPVGQAFGWVFALFTVIASFGIGNFTQSNSIADSINITFHVPTSATGIVITILAILILVGGIYSISRFSLVVVPLMACLYTALSLIVILGNIENVPTGIITIFHMAFSPQAVGGGLCGSLMVSMADAIKLGVSRGCFSNEAGMGSTAITAAAASTDDPVRQGYINMTGTFWDTIVLCSITGLSIACSGMLGQTDPITGSSYTGVSLTIAAFETVLGHYGSWCVCICICLFAFATILGWEYQGEKAFEFIVGDSRCNMLYRIIFSLMVFTGATTTLQIAWSFSDIANALMCIPNLICLVYLSKECAADMINYQDTVHKSSHHI